MKGIISDWERDRFLREASNDISALAEIEEPLTTNQVVGPEPIVLMERSCGGWRVELRLTASGEPAILVQAGEEASPQGCLVPPESALDAFHHPYCYLPA